MQIIDKLYTYGMSDKKLDKIIAKVKKGKVIPNLCLITLPLFEDGILEIYDYNQFQQAFYIGIKKDIVVLGFAPDKAMAQEIVLSITQDLYDADCDFDVRKFFGI